MIESLGALAISAPVIARQPQRTSPNIIGIHSGVLRIYGRSTYKLLIELPLSFTEEAGGTLTASPSNGIAIATGTAAAFRLFKSHEVAIMQGTVGASSADLNLSTTAITTGDNIFLNYFTIKPGSHAC